ncbi:DUF5947 family protein [Gandjariella thermophila]|uniref:Uncharacterized protein n=1 Tax=Gandjariella thermophila TaxID=1931992 RepID=A0A4D4J0V1_9PSEU|nr:DUF5947 family protein [Gandjariella thermophila]GDY28428.1 hypothetical protein GTS_00610 [Gandjariella thermophila]
MGPAPSFHAHRLRRIARRPGAAGAPAGTEGCEMCAEPVPSTHRHLLEIGADGGHRVLCACQACALLFDHRAAGGGHYRLVPQRRVPLPDFRMDDLLWAGLGVPVDMAFFVRHADGAVTARYPGPLGTVRAAVVPETWRRIEELNPELSGMDTDVEALLVRRSRDSREHWLVGVDDCYRLAALVRTCWTGISGGSQVWTRLEEFFAGLRGEAPHRREGP